MAAVVRVNPWVAPQCRVTRPPVAAFSSWGLDTWVEQDPSWRKQAEFRWFWSAEGGAKRRGRYSQNTGSANPFVFRWL